MSDIHPEVMRRAYNRTKALSDRKPDMFGLFEKYSEQPPIKAKSAHRFKHASTGYNPWCYGGEHAGRLVDQVFLMGVSHVMPVDWSDPCSTTVENSVLLENLLVLRSRDHTRALFRHNSGSAEVSKPTEFTPSAALLDFVVRYLSHEEQQQGGDLYTIAAQKVRESVWGLLRSMADALRHSGLKSLDLGTERFDAAVAKACLYRIPVDFYEGLEFVQRLHAELRSAARAGVVKGRYWVLDGDMTLRALPRPEQRADEPLEERAQMRRYGG